MEGGGGLSGGKKEVASVVVACWGSVQLVALVLWLMKYSLPSGDTAVCQPGGRSRPPTAEAADEWRMGTKREAGSVGGVLPGGLISPSSVIPTHCPR